MADYRTTPPNHCKDAVPSPRGWRHPKTGELLVAVFLDMAKFEKPKVAKSNAKESKTAVKVIEDVTPTQKVEEGEDA